MPEEKKQKQYQKQYEKNYNDAKKLLSFTQKQGSYKKKSR